MSMEEFQQTFPRHIKTLFQSMEAAVQMTSYDAIDVIRHNAPVAFGDLSNSVHQDMTDGHYVTRIDAPHAAAVEIGSRPHFVPLEELIKWVKLRGMQGLSKTGKVRSSLPKSMGTTTALHAISVAAELKSMERNGSLHVDAAEQIARRIQYHISKYGTRPHWFVRQSLPKIRAILARNMREALDAFSNGSMRAITRR